jgi:acyl dehydratase
MAGAEPKERPVLDFAGLVGAPISWSDWIAVPQSRIDGFALSTGNDAFIHANPARLAATRLGGAIAHGLLVLSLLPLMLRNALPSVRDARMKLNYGFDQIRLRQDWQAPDDWSTSYVVNSVILDWD